MSLSNDLISQFVKATKDKKETKKEATLYGTVVKDGNIHKVKLDGSNELTPVANTSEIVEHDRVTVMIKNHKAIVTGNMSHPSVNTMVLADYIQTNKFEAEVARIDTVISNNATITKADIDKLTTRTAEIDVKLTAKSAEIEALDAKKLNVSTADITYAKIDSLGSLTADIRELMFGSATGNTIQTSFSNTVIGQLGDAQIKSAMIESISADKITAGYINTDNIQVRSNAGYLRIKGDTLQIRDDKGKSRVQIGRDASGDYSINVWDQNGILMFSKGGITDAAIKDAIIRNDMVSDEANIDAGKLNIDSLFTEINNSTNTIKSSQVYLDNEKQTLDIAFKSLLSEVLDNGYMVSSQGTSIEALQGYIATKIWQQDIDTAKNELSTQYSTLEQTVDSFKTTVSETYTTKAELNNLEIGGRNLLQDTNRGKQHWSASGYDGSYVVEDYTDVDGVLGVKLITNTPSTSWNFGAFWMGNTLPLLLPKTEYVLSFDMLTDVTESLNVSIKKGDGLKTFTASSSTIQTIDDEKWHNYKFIITTNDLSAGIDNQCLYFSRFNTVGYRIIKNLKLEKGNKPTDWTPAPEDVENRVSSAETKISQNTKSINLTATNLSTNYSTTAQMNAAIEVSANAITSTVSDLQTNFNSLSIGGRNLHTGSTEDEIRLNDYNGVGGFKQFTKFSFDASNPEYIGKEFTISLWAKSPNGTTQLSMYNSNGDPRYFRFSTTLDQSLGNEWKYYKYTFTNKDSGASHTGNFTRVEFYASSQLGVLIKKLKVELGNRATDWTPAPEDVDGLIAANKTLIEQTATDLSARIETSSKTATNYLNFSSNGLTIGDLTTNTLGKNVLIGSESVKIRTGTTDNAIFAADLIELAKNNESATISMLNGAFKIYYDSDNSDGGFGIYGKASDGSYRLAFQPVNENGNLTLGWGGYAAKVNSTNLYGHKIYLTTNEDIILNPGNGSIQLDGNVYISNGKNIFGTNTSGAHRSIAILNTSNQMVFGYGSYDNNEGAAFYNGNDVYVRSKKDIHFETQNETIVLQDGDGNATYSAFFRPGSNAKCTLGTNANRWYAVYASNATIQTSDVREKENIVSLGDIHSELFDKLKPVQYNFIDGNGRVCYGLVAQDVIAAMKELGIEENELDIVHHDVWIDEETKEVKDSYGLAYANLIAMLIHEVQKLKRRKYGETN